MLSFQTVGVLLSLTSALIFIGKLMRDALFNLLPWAVMFLTSIDIAYATRVSEKLHRYGQEDLVYQCEIEPEFEIPPRSLAM